MSDRRTEARHPSSAGLQDAAPVEVLRRLLVAQEQAVAAVRPAIPGLASAAGAAAAALGNGHRLIYAGAGSSGLMALSDCLELAGTFGIPPDRTPMLLAGGAATLLHMTGAVEDDPALAQADLARVAPVPGDVLLCLSASGSTPYALAVARGAKSAGALVIGMANVAGSPLLTLADIALLLDTGPEIVAGSTRMGAGSAQKVALNMLSTLVGVRLGHVHDGHMVNVLADNAKLVDRAARIVADISGADQAKATEAIKTSGGAVKAAILIAAGASPARAETLLDRYGGRLGPALAEMTDRTLTDHGAKARQQGDDQ